MTIIRQPSLFGIQELYDMEPTEKYDAIISAIDLDAIYYAVTKKSRLGAPEELNYAAMIISCFVRYVERIPTIKDLIKRLHKDIAFKLNCGFLVSDSIPSEASYSRLVTKLLECDILEKQKEKVVLQAIEGGFITDDTAAMDATTLKLVIKRHRKKKSQSPSRKNVGAKQKKNGNNG